MLLAACSTAAQHVAANTSGACTLQDLKTHLPMSRPKPVALHTSERVDSYLLGPPSGSPSISADDAWRKLASGVSAGKDGNWLIQTQLANMPMDAPGRSAWVLYSARAASPVLGGGYQADATSRPAGSPCSFADRLVAIDAITGNPIGSAYFAPQGHDFMGQPHA